MGDILSKEYWSSILEKVTNWFIEYLPNILALVVITWILLKVTSFVTKKLNNWVIQRVERETRFKDKDKEGALRRLKTVIKILSSLLRIIIITSAILLLLKIIGVDISPFITGAGIVGLAVGFGSQELVKDIIGGFFIILENNMRVGDVVTIEGCSGLVESIGFRTVILRDITGTIHVLRNGQIKRISNMTIGWSAAVLDIPVSYKEDINKVTEVIRQVTNELVEDDQFKENIISEPEILGVDSFGENAVMIKLRVKTIPLQQWGIAREIRKRLKERFQQENIVIPLPQIVLHNEQNK